MPLATMAHEARGRAGFAIRALIAPAIPAATPTGPIATGAHIHRSPKLAASCSKKISAAVIAEPAAINADNDRSNRPVATSHSARLINPVGACSATVAPLFAPEPVPTA